MNAASLGGRFAKLWTASTTSALGSGLTLVAAPLYVAAHTRSPLVISAATGVAWLPWLLFALPGGVLVDRVDRRRLMVTIDCARAAAMGVLAVAVAAGWASIALLFLVLFAINTGEAVFRSASQSMIPAVVPRAQLERANGWLLGGTTLTQNMIAGPLGGFLFIVAASIPFFANAGTYAVSAVFVGLLAGSYRASPGTAGGTAAGSTAADGTGADGTGADGTRGAWTVLTDVAEGFRWLVRQRLLRTMALLISLLNLTLTAATAVLVLLARERLHVGSVGYGALFSCEAAGTLAGAVWGDRLIRRVTATWTIRIGLLIEAGMHLTLATTTSVYLAGAMMLAFGVHAALWTIVGSSLRQRLTPPEMLGRVNSTTIFISTFGNCAGALLGGVIATDFGITAPYWAGFGVAAVVAACTWHVFNRATVAQAYAEPAGTYSIQPLIARTIAPALHDEHQASRFSKIMDTQPHYSVVGDPGSRYCRRPGRS